MLRQLGFVGLAAATAASSGPPVLLCYNLSYTDTELPRADAFEHTLLVAALSGLANRDAPRLFTPYMPADAQWKELLAQQPGGWFANTTFEALPAGGSGALLPLVQRVRGAWAAGADAIRGLVLYDPLVPATSNVASTAAGVEGLLPVAKRNASAGAAHPTAYEQLAGMDATLPVLLDLTAMGFRGGPVTGSAKADAYLWATARYLNGSSAAGAGAGAGADAATAAAQQQQQQQQQLADPTLLAYYVDYFAATLTPAPPLRPTPPPTPAPPTPPPPPAGADRLTQGQRLGPGASLVSANALYHLEMQGDRNLVLYEGSGAAQRALWASNTAGGGGGGGALTLDGADGKLSVIDVDSGKVVWSAGGDGGSGGKYWAWMQHDGNFVLYAGTCCTGTALWSTQTAQPPLRGVAGVAGATGTVGAVSVPVPVPEDGSDFVQAKTVNHDYFIANRAFFFDLSVWGDETPNDEPWQPLGSDRAALRALLGAAQAAATVASGGESTMIHMGGFTPWHFKYVAEGICGAAKCKHSGVPTEWETMEVASGYNVFADADACCTVGTMANAALWQHYPLPAKLAQPFSPPTVAALQARGLVGADGRTVAGKAFAAYYAGDYDSAAWAYNELLDNFDDGSADRGKTPIGWAVDPELSLRFPPVFARLWAAATPNDVFISGDSGAGYVNPTRLPDGGAAWGRWNAKWFSKFDLNFTGFVINGAAGVMTAAAEAVYAGFSPAGVVYSAADDPRGGGNGGGLTKEGVPVMHHVTDLPKGIAMADALQQVAAYAGAQAGAAPTFGVFRTILQPAAFHHAVATGASAASSNLEWVDPVTMGILVKIHASGCEISNV